MTLRQRRINETLREVNWTDHKHINCIRLHKSTTRKHRDKMYEVCTWLLENDHDFITECKFKFGTRTDILILDEQICVEILCTETEEQFNNKSYPFTTMSVRVGEKFNGI